jgi:hypothetical protein
MLLLWYFVPRKDNRKVGRRESRREKRNPAYSNCSQKI